MESLIMSHISNPCEKPESFNKIFGYVFVTLLVIFLGFSELCYMNWGKNLNEPIVTELLPKDDKTVIITKILFCLILFPSFVLVINPAN